MGWTSVQQAYLPSGWTQDVSIETGVDGTIVNIEVGNAPRAAVQKGLLLPGLVNAHTHLEQAWRPRMVPGGEGFVSWVRGLREDLPPAELSDALRSHARGMKAGGTAAVSDIANFYDALPIWADVGMQGVVQREFLGFTPHARDAAIAAVKEFSADVVGDLWERPAAHAPYSTPPQLIQAALSHPSRGPASIHLAEDAGEIRFLMTGEGEFAQFMDELAVEWRWWTPPGLSPVAYLESLGCLGPRVLAVHGVHLSEQGIDTLANTQTPLCICPRSNLHIGGALPDVSRLMAVGVRLCLGTDSVASSPDTDVLAEIPVLADRFPNVALETWIDMATRGGADVLGLPHLGRISPGARPGLLLLEECPSPSALAESVDFSRKWLVEPGGRA